MFSYRKLTRFSLVFLSKINKVFRSRLLVARKHASIKGDHSMRINWEVVVIHSQGIRGKIHGGVGYLEIGLQAT
jgi:hypothetical protein